MQEMVAIMLWWLFWQNGQHPCYERKVGELLLGLMKWQLFFCPPLKTIFLLILASKTHSSAYTIQLGIYIPKTLGLFKSVPVGCGEPRSRCQGCAVCMKWLPVLLQAYTWFALCPYLPEIHPADLVMGPRLFGGYRVPHRCCHSGLRPWAQGEGGK